MSDTNPELEKHVNYSLAERFKGWKKLSLSTALAIPASSGIIKAIENYPEAGLIDAKTGLLGTVSAGLGLACLKFYGEAYRHFEIARSNDKEHSLPTYYQYIAEQNPPQADVHIAPQDHYS